MAALKIDHINDRLDAMKLYEKFFIRLLNNNYTMNYSINSELIIKTFPSLRQKTYVTPKKY